MRTKLTFEEGEKLCLLYEQNIFKNTSNWKEILSLLGLISKHIEEYWVNSSEKICYLEVKDERKWLLSKIKYGI